MANVIDALFIELGLDVSKMNKGQKDASDTLKKLEDNSSSTAKKFEEHGKQMAQAIYTVRNQVLSLMTAFTAGAGIKTFFNAMTSGDAATGRLANNIGMSVGQLTAWQGAAERAGGSAQGIAGTFQNLAQQYQQFALTGQSSVLPYFRALGVSLADQAGKMRPLGDVLLDLSDKFSGMDPARAQYLGRNMGIDEGTINVLIKGRSAVSDYLKEQEKIGHANEKDAAAAQKRQAMLEKLKQTFENLGRKELTKFTDKLIEMGDQLERLGTWLSAHPDIFAGMTASVVVLTTALGALSALKIFKLLLGGGGAAAAGETVAGGGAMGILGPLALAAGGSYGIYKGLEWLKDRRGFLYRDFGSLDAWKKAYKGHEDDIKKFMDMGWSESQSLAIVANIQRESDGNEKAVGDNGDAFGLAQWHKDRQKLFAKQFGHDIRNSTHDEQLKFIDWELRNSEKASGDALKNAKNAADAAASLSSMYERPQDIFGEAVKRAGIADAMSRMHNLIGVGGTQNSAHSETHIGVMHINAPQAKDAPGIARAIGDSMDKHTIAAMANSGLS